MNTLKKQTIMNKPRGVSVFLFFTEKKETKKLVSDNLLCCCVRERRVALP